MLEPTKSEFWRADDNEGVPIDNVSKEIAAYKPGATFEDDYAAFQALFQVQPHPCVCPSVSTEYSNGLSSG